MRKPSIKLTDIFCGKYLKDAIFLPTAFKWCIAHTTGQR